MIIGNGCYPRKGATKHRERRIDAPHRAHSLTKGPSRVIQKDGYHRQYTHMQWHALKSDASRIAARV